MKKLYSLTLLLAFALISNAQTVITQWNFDNVDPAASMLPTTGSGVFTKIGGVEDNLTSGLMPAGNPSTGKAYSVKTFPAAGSLNGTAGYQFTLSTVGFNDQINVTFDPRGSNTSSKWQGYEYTTDGTTWVAAGNNAGALTNSFTASPMVTLTLPAVCSNKANFAFRIVAIYDATSADYAPVGATSTYGPSGAWRIDNVTFSSGALSVNQNAIAGLKVYPNPVSNGKLFIETSANAEKTVIIYDLLGKKVLNTITANSEINVASLNSGIYIVKITEEGNTTSRKLVIR
ncbi:T9SS type A sorting domain-containing protein [Flavobacterium sp.]